MGLFLSKSHILIKCWAGDGEGLDFYFKLDWGSCIISIPKTVSKKTGALICLMRFLHLRLLCISLLNLLYNHVWNTAVMSGLVLQATTWNC